MDLYRQTNKAVCVCRERERLTDIIFTATHFQMKNKQCVLSLQAQKSNQPTDVEGIEQSNEANSALNPGKIIVNTILISLVLYFELIVYKVH